MRIQTTLAMCALLFFMAGCTAREPARPAEAAPGAVAVDFDSAPTGRVPASWRAEGTRQDSAPLAEWAVIKDPSAPSQPRALALTASPHGQSQIYNLCWTETIRFQNGRLSVKFKAMSGKVDQGGGPIWRVRDANNYYICRANPLENNFRLYKVTDGTRKQLATVDVSVPTSTWHTIEVEHEGDRIVCTLNGVTRIEATDNALPATGGVGLWTKADAATVFDDLIVSPAR